MSEEIRRCARVESPPRAHIARFNIKKPKEISMKNIPTVLSAFTLIGLCFAPLPLSSQEAAENMSFFVTTVGPGDGADLGGLSGADAHCQSLAEAVGAGDRTWRAYLSVTASSGQPAVNARERIGEGPWHNVEGELIAESVADLHSDSANISEETALTETGETPSRHDMLTGSQLDGTAFPAGEDRTCQSWTSSDQGRPWVGHSDRRARGVPGSPWNSAHASAGCSPADLRSTGGDGLFYCFAAD